MLHCSRGTKSNRRNPKGEDSSWRIAKVNLRKSLELSLDYFRICLGKQLVRKT